MVNTEARKKTGMTYHVFSSVCRTNGSEGAVVYGIRAVCWENGDRVVEFDDISPDMEKVERLKEILVSSQIEPEQIKYIVEDYLEQIYS
ncbi:MAG: hypothetical protein GX254_06360 [Clostridiales bacterium]|jgi:hypothetical protein|nr:hypothetical protein [Clostridiales bacterium]